MARIGFGVMQLEPRPNRKAALAILTAATDAGIDHFDAVAFYGDYNELIIEALGRDETASFSSRRSAPHATQQEISCPDKNPRN